MDVPTMLRRAATVLCVLVLTGATSPVSATPPTVDGPAMEAVTAAASDGYWLVAGDGGVFAFGTAPFLGSAAGTSTHTVVDIAKTQTGRGYWLAADDGGVFSFGDARFFGSLPGLPGAPRGETVVAMASSTLFGDGYYLVTASGGVYTFGAAPFFGAPASRRVPHPIIDFGLTPSGHGYWLVDTAGHIDSYGDAPALRVPEVDPATAPVDDLRIALEPWSNLSVHVMSIGGGVFTASTSPETGFFYGATVSTGRPMTDLASCGCSGYYQVDADGTVFTHGDARDLGSINDLFPADRLAGPVFAMLRSGPDREL